MNKWLLIALFTVCGSCSLAQKHDYIWCLGYDRTPDPSNGFGISCLNFNNYPVDMKFNDSLNFAFYLSSTTYSSFTGELLFYTNGLSMKNVLNETLHGSDTFNDYHYHDIWYRSGLPMIQGIEALSVTKDSIYLLYAKSDHGIIEGVSTGFVTGISYSLIDGKGDNGLGSMVSKDNLVLTDTISQAGCILSTKHANGRDWWTIIPNLNSNVYHRILTSTNGPDVLASQEVGEPVGNGLIQAAFSPDGQWYARNTIANVELDRLDLYRFDRSTGVLSNHQQLYYDGKSSWGGGVVFSANSQYLYVIGIKKIFQFDLRAKSWQETKTVVAVYDGFTEFIPNANVKTQFFLGWNGPDGKIYICSDHANSYLHTIHYPNEKGVACQVEQHSIKLGSYHNRTVPNHPNYRLGPIDGSVCDTLGIDNVPLAGLRYELLEDREVRFTDNSWYEPASWYWTFGDGQSSADTSPYHTYQDTGLYEVCLAISNVNGADTFCRMVYVTDLFSATHAVEPVYIFSIFPNPADDYLMITSSEYIGQAQIRLIDMQGQIVLHSEKNIEIDQLSKIDVSSLATGLYILEIWKDDVKVGSKKVVVN